MAYSGSVAKAYALVPATQDLGPEALLMEVGTGTLATGTVEVPTKLTSIQFAYLSYDGAVTSGGETEALTTDKGITSSAVTVTGKGNLTFSYIFIGRAAAQL